MGATPEAKVKAKVKAVLKELGAYYAMPIGTGYGNSGVPDFLVCYKGKFIGIECKAKGNKPTTLQQSHLESIKHTGGHALIVDETNVNSLKSVLQEV
jgi:pantoate kinase